MNETLKRYMTSRKYGVKPAEAWKAAMAGAVVVRLSEVDLRTIHDRWARANPNGWMAHLNRSIRESRRSLDHHRV